MAWHSSLASRPAQALWLGAALLMNCRGYSALAQSEWLQSGRLSVAEIRALCEQVNDIRLLARMQMLSAGNTHWRQLSRQELVIERTIMGVPPLNPNRCYVIAHAGSKWEVERRAFEVRDFAINPGRTSVFIIGRDYEPPEPGSPQIPCEPASC